MRGLMLCGTKTNTLAFTRFDKIRFDGDQIDLIKQTLEQAKDPSHQIRFSQKWPISWVKAPLRARK